MTILTIRAIILFVIAFCNVALSSILWRGARSESTRFWLGCTALFSGAYAFFCAATYFFWGGSYGASLLWYKLTWAGVLILPCFLLFAFSFVMKGKPMKYWQLAVSLVAAAGALIILFFALTTDLFVKSLFLSGINVSSVAGPLDWVGRLYIFLGLAFTLVVLIRDYVKAEGPRKLQVKYFLLGAAVFMITGILATSVAPFLMQESPYYDIAAFASLVWVYLTAYAILRYRLLNLSLVIAQLFTISIWIAFLIRLLLSVSVQDFAFNAVLFAAVLLFGGLLIKVAFQEQREKTQILAMADQMAKAYETQKHANEELRRFEVARNEFMLITQHHLRTPLTAIMGYADLLLGGNFGKVNKKASGAIVKMQAAAQSLIAMANDFLDITQFQMGKSGVVTVPGVPVMPLVRAAVAQCALEAQEKGLMLLVEPSQEGGRAPNVVMEKILVAADREKLIRALAQIIRNGIRYTEQGKVQVRVSQRPHMVRIDVVDTGIGIAPERLTGIFDRIFERGAQAERNVPVGRGIGLYLSAQIIRHHGGKIWAESKGEGQGATFHIELPLDAEK